MRVNRAFIEQFKPCRDRWENYLDHYADFDGTWPEFLELDKISALDKIWVFSRVIPEIEGQQREFALMCACRAVDECDVPEIQEFLNLQILIVQEGLWDLKEDAAYRAAHLAAYRAADSAAYWAAYWAADRAADRAAEWAADSAADSAAYRAAYLAAYRTADWAARKQEIETQVEMIKWLMRDI